MKKEDLFEALEGASDAYLESAAEAMMAKADTAQTVIPGGGKHRRWTQFLKQPRSWISAACILLSVSLLAVTLLLGSMYGFHLGPLSEFPMGPLSEIPMGSPGQVGSSVNSPTRVETPEEKKQEFRDMASEVFADYPWTGNEPAIRAYAEEQDCVIRIMKMHETIYGHRELFIDRGSDLLEAFFEQTKKGEVKTLKIIEFDYTTNMRCTVLLHFDGEIYHQVVTYRPEDYNGRSFYKGYHYFLRFEQQGENESGTYLDEFYYLGGSDMAIPENHYGWLNVILRNPDYIVYRHMGCVRTYIEEDDPDSVSLRYDQATDCFEIVYSDGRKETYRECDLFTVIRDALHGDYITDPFSSAVPEGFYIASFETPVKLSPVDPETLDIDSLPSPFSNKDNEAVFMSKDCLWLKIGTDWYACARENLPWVK